MSDIKLVGHCPKHPPTIMHMVECPWCKVERLTAENNRLNEALEEMECLLFANETKSVWEIQSKGTAIRAKALKGEEDDTN